MCPNCGDESCMGGSRFQECYMGIESTDDYESFTSPYHSQDAPPTYDATTPIAESPAEMSSLNNKNPTYVAEAQYTATMPNPPNNAQQWSLPTQFEYNTPQPFASYGNPAGQVYPHVAEQSYGPVKTQAGFQSDYSHRLRGNQSYDEQQEAEHPDLLPYPTYMQSPGSDPYSANSNFDQAPVFQQRSDSQPTNSFPMWQMSSQASRSFTSTIGDPSYADKQPFSSTQLPPSPLGCNAPGGNTSCAPPSYPGPCQHPACLSDPKKSTVFQKEKDWESHNHRTHAKRFPCGYPGCGRVFGTAADAQRHRIPIHKEISGAKVRSCDVVGCQGRKQLFYRSDKLKEHNNRWHGPYPCPKPDCPRGNGYGFADKEALNKHKRSHHR